MPKKGDIHIDQLLTNVAAGYMNGSFIAEQVLPVVRVAKEANKVPRFGRAHFRTDFAARAPGAEVLTVEYDVDSVAYACEEFSLDHPIDRRISALADDPFDPESNAVMYLTEMLKRKVETIVAGLLTTTANYASGHSDTTAKQWDQASPGDCVAHVTAAATAIIKNAAADKSQLYGIATRPVFDVLQQHPKVKEKWANPSSNMAPGIMSTKQVAQALGLQDIFVGDASYNTAREGAAAESMSWIWGNETFIVFARTGSPGIGVPNLGYTLVPAATGGRLVYAEPTYYSNKRKSDVVTCTAFMDAVITAPYFGYIFTNTLGAS